jgi:hypothetical protein
MRRFIAIVIAALVIFIASDDGGTFAANAAISPDTNAGRPSSMSVSYYSAFAAYFNGYGYVIEQQTTDWSSPVVNPTPAERLWDIDDLRTVFASGSLASGESYSITVPFIADNTGHLLYLTGDAGNKGGTLTLSVPEGALSYSWPVGRDGFHICLDGPYYYLGDPQLSDISGSNGGRGLPATYTWTVTANSRTNTAGLTLQIVYPNLSNKQSLCGGTNNTALDGRFLLVGP